MSDLGSFTLLFRQPVAALQIRDPVHNEWKWVKPQDATLTVNACDALSFLTGGYVKSTIHRYSVFEEQTEHHRSRRLHVQCCSSSQGPAARRPSRIALLLSVC